MVTCKSMPIAERFLLFVLVSTISLCPITAFPGTTAGEVRLFEESKSHAGTGDATAQHNLGVYYNQGVGVERNLRLALYWWRKSADQGFAMAYTKVANCYYLGEGVEKDLVQAMYWYRKAADMGEVFSQYMFAIAA